MAVDGFAGPALGAAAGAGGCRDDGVRQAKNTFSSPSPRIVRELRALEASDQ